MTSLQNVMKPLKDYLSDKKEMIEVMFSCIEENQLKKMIPDCLKDTKIEEVKAECLVELLGMSKKRITGILQGRELDESSEDSLELSDISEDDTNIKTERESPEKSKSKKKCGKESKTRKGKKAEMSSSSESDEEEKTSKKKKNKKRKEDSGEEDVPSKKKKNKGEGSKEKKQDTSDVELSLEDENKGGKNLLEILELEMRARAIRSLIEREEKKGKTKESVPSTTDSNKPSIHLDVLDDDPDAVIIVDEAADQIDLTKDESDMEINKPAAPQPRIYRSNSRHCSPVNTLSHEQTSKTVDKVQELGSSQDKTSETYVPRNWTERWLESNDVQKVMKTTKVLTNLKKRLINVNKQKSLEEKKEVVTNCVGPTIIEGTVSEYSLLEKKTSNDKETHELHVSIDQQIIQDGESAVETHIGREKMDKIVEEPQQVNSPIETSLTGDHQISTHDTIDSTEQ